MSENVGDAGDSGDSVDAKRVLLTRKSEAPEVTAKVRREGEAKAVSVDPHRYRMDYPSIGTCVIVNNKNFHKSTGMAPRHGTDLDAEAATNTFSRLGYNIRMFNDLAMGDLEREFNKVSQEDHSGSASFVCVLLSHGDEGIIYGTDGAVQLQTLTGMFRGDRCKTLVAKPKLFFIQACRGTCLDSGIETDSSSDQSSDKIPVEADFMYAYSTAPGYYAWRNMAKGSWFMQALCEMLQQHSSQLELMQIMTRVNHKVALEFQTTNIDPEISGMKQMPAVTSLLTKDFYFPH